MNRANSIQVRQPWTLLHEREEQKAKVATKREVERALAAQHLETRLNRTRDKIFADVTLCSRPYF
jgi:hypothetical protein